MTKTETKANPLWGGHFNAGPAEVMQRINESVSFDKNLYEQDIAGSIAHCEMLVKKKIISPADGKTIIKGLQQVKKEIFRGQFQFRAELEDIHMNIEARLHELIGDTAGKLHTARSRNDQVATDFKLYVMTALQQIDLALKEMQSEFLKKAELHHDTLMPGYTHLQTAQPVTFGHHLMAYVEMFGRDRSRANDALKRISECPLGAAALAGTSFPIGRKGTAKALGFDRPTSNSIDSVSDRDFALEFLSNAAIISTHLSRFAEEIVIWMSADFKFVTLSDSYTTGSSIMPQKRNPDAAELIRGKSGRMFGNMISLFTVMKGLPLTYSKDMQEDKEPVFDTVKNLSLCLAAMTGMVKDMKVNKDKMLEAAGRGYSTATDLADWLVQNLGIPFRKAHHITGKVVRLAEEKKCTLEEITLTEMQRIHADITDDVFRVLSLENSVKSRKSLGGTAPENVLKAIKAAKKRYDI